VEARQLSSRTKNRKTALDKDALTRLWSKGMQKTKRKPH